MVVIKSKDLDKLCDDFEVMKFKAGPWWPSIEDIKKHLEPHLKSCINFAIWITETADEPQTDAQRASKKYLLKLIYKNLAIASDDVGGGKNA